MEIFALYTCQQSKNVTNAIHRKALHIASESESTNSELISRTLFIEAIQSICKMASTDLMKAAIETGYMTDLYTPSDYQSLSASID